MYIIYYYVGTGNSLRNHVFFVGIKRLDKGRARKQRHEGAKEGGRGRGRGRKEPGMQGFVVDQGLEELLQVQVLVTFFWFLDMESKQPSSLTATNATSNETNEPSNQEGIKEATDQSNIPMNIHIHTLCLLFSRFVYICG